MNGHTFPQYNYFVLNNVTRYLGGSQFGCLMHQCSIRYPLDHFKIHFFRLVLVWMFRVVPQSYGYCGTHCTGDSLVSRQVINEIIWHKYLPVFTMKSMKHARYLCSKSLVSGFLLISP